MKFNHLIRAIIFMIVLNDRYFSIEMTAEDEEDNLEDDYYNDSISYYKVKTEPIVGDTSKEQITSPQQPTTTTTTKASNMNKDQIQRIKSTISDSIMEEVIGYYGDKLSKMESIEKSFEEMKQNVSKVESLLQLIGNRYRKMQSNQRTMADIIRNNIILPKRRQKKLKSKLITETASTLPPPPPPSPPTTTTTTTVESIINRHKEIHYKSIELPKGEP
jgi:hypothetical protein